MSAPELITADDPNAEICTSGGLVDHDWRPYIYQQYGRPHASWRCVWCHTVMCGDYGETNLCRRPYHHTTPHRDGSGVTWPLGGDRP